MYQENIEKVKYIHIMSHISTVYNAQIVCMINENNEDFDNEEHLFIISNQKVYEPIKHYKNVIFVENISTNGKILKKYANMCKYIFLHSNTLSTRVLLQLSNDILKKIIWCEWGHDLYDKKEKTKTLYRKIRKMIGNVIKVLPNYIRNKKTRKFYAAGIGFQYDAIEVKRRFGNNMKIVMTPYGYIKGNKKNIDNIINNTEKVKDYKRIMVGHSAYPFLNHIKLLNQLEKYKNENIIISLVLAYGDRNYAEEVKREAIKIFGKKKVEIIDNMISQEEYVKYLSTVDICLLDYKHQAALGNIYFLLYMEKKLFLNKKGIIKLCSILENIETYNIDDISQMNYKEFSQEIKNKTYGKQFAEFHINEQNYIELWKNTINELDNNIKIAENN